MPKALVFNPGSNSLKFEVIKLAETQSIASDARTVASAMVESIGKDAKLQQLRDHYVVHEQPCNAEDMEAAAHVAMDWLSRQRQNGAQLLDGLTFAAVRVVHGGMKYTGAVRIDDEVRHEIEELEELAPLHNQNALTILDVLKTHLAETPLMATFDTAFHRTLPEVAWRYPIEPETADRHGIRKFGFHGLSHRYMLEQYARTVGKSIEDITVVTLHLESGCSAAAIRHGRSVDTTMGMTPLEGLMMGSRSGSIDPALVPLLMEKEKISAGEVMTLLNKRSGLIGIAGGSLDTRILVKRDDEAAKLALSMFSYRVRLAVGAYLAALGDAEAVLFGGGIGEDSPWLRAQVCEGLRGWGLDLDSDVNERQTEGQARLTREGSRLHAWAMSVEEGLQMAHECWLALRNETPASLTAL